MNIREITEARYHGVPLIYHAASFGSAVEILNRGRIEPWTEIEVNGKLIHGISLTRSFWFATVFNDVVFGLDLNAVRQKFQGRMTPFADPSIDNKDEYGDEIATGDHRREAEEFVIGPINLAGLLVGVWISSDHGDPNHPGNAPHVEELKQHPFFKGFTRKWPYHQPPGYVAWTKAKEKFG